MKRALMDWFNDHQLPTFVGLALIIALIFTSISLMIYSKSGAAKLDLSRPGYESVRQDVENNDATEQPFASSGAIDAKVKADFEKRVKTQADQLDKMNDFNAEVISNDNLGLPADNTATPTTDDLP
jgi:hypothetical protein